MFLFFRKKSAWLSCLLPCLMLAQIKATENTYSILEVELEPHAPENDDEEDRKEPTTHFCFLVQHDVRNDDLAGFLISTVHPKYYSGVQGIFGIELKKNYEEKQHSGTLTESTQKAEKLVTALQKSRKYLYNQDKIKKYLNYHDSEQNENGYTLSGVGSSLLFAYRYKKKIVIALGTGNNVEPKSLQQAGFLLNQSSDNGADDPNQHNDPDDQGKSSRDLWAGILGGGALLGLIIVVFKSFADQGGQPEKKRTQEAKNVKKHASKDRSVHKTKQGSASLQKSRQVPDSSPAASTS